MASVTLFQRAMASARACQTCWSPWMRKQESLPRTTASQQSLCCWRESRSSSCSTSCCSSSTTSPFCSHQRMSWMSTSQTSCHISSLVRSKVSFWVWAGFFREMDMGWEWERAAGFWPTSLSVQRLFACMCCSQAARFALAKQIKHDAAVASLHAQSCRGNVAAEKSFELSQKSSCSSCQEVFHWSLQHNIYWGNMQQCACFFKQNIVFISRTICGWKIVGAIDIRRYANTAIS